MLARALPATGKRHALASANAWGMTVQNEARNSVQSVQNDGSDDDIAIA
jgi:hypothetical protein